MKYEAVFGDQSLFDGAPECATHATKGGGFYYVDSGIVKFISNMFFGARDVCGLAGYLVAERRIIKEPKRWTREDKKAGVLPEVGAKCRQSHKDEIVVAVTEKFVVTECQDMSVCTTRKDVFMRSYNPIETPAEKAQREEDEWVNKAWSETAVFAGVTQDEHDRLRIHLRHIYRAQLSGELAAPKGGE